jgi:O-antigen ligase
VLLRRRAIEKREALLFVKVGASLVFLFLLFIAANLIALGKNPQEILSHAAVVIGVDGVTAGLVRAFDDTVAKVPQAVMPGDFIGFKALLSSRFSSAFGVSGLLMVVIGLWALTQQRRTVAPESSSSFGIDAPSLLWSLFAGVFVASLLLAVYMVVQTVTGFDYRSPTGILAVEHRQDNGLYRIFGFYGHPLSVAGVALFWSVMNGWLLGGWLSDRLNGGTAIAEAIGWRQSAWSRRWLPWVLATTLAVQFLFIVLSGGRTALLAFFVMAGLLGLRLRLPQRLRRMRWLALFGALPLLSVVLYLSGALSRFQVAQNKIEKGAVVDDRFFFWKVHLRMFLDSPWFGQGHAHLEAWVRRAYYLGMDYPRLAFRKNFPAHNIFLETITDVGVVGTLALVAILVVMWRLLSAAVRSCPSARLLFVIFSWGVVANLLHGLTENTFFASNIALVYLMVLWVILWLIVAERRRSG